MKEILRNSIIIYYLVKQLKKTYPDRQIGKTTIQRLIYLFEYYTRNNFKFSMYHYGVYSSDVSEYLNMAETLGLISISWNKKLGYSIEPKEKIRFFIDISIEEKQILDKIVGKYGRLSPIELFVITTALFSRDHFKVVDIKEMTDIILSLRPYIDIHRLQGCLTDIF